VLAHDVSKDRPEFTRRPHAITGYQRRHARLLRIYTRAIALRTLRDIRSALANFDKLVKCAIAGSPELEVAPGALVTVIGVTIALSTSAFAPATQAADTSGLLKPDRAVPAARAPQVKSREILRRPAAAAHAQPELRGPV